jgi:hypothetical protein
MAELESLLNAGTKLEKTSLKKSSIPNSQVALAVNPNVEFSFTLPKGTKRFLIKAVDGDFKIGFVSGNLNFTIGSGSAYWEEGLELNSDLTIYYSSDTSNSKLEIIYWV